HVLRGERALSRAAGGAAVRGRRGAARRRRHPAGAPDPGLRAGRGADGPAGPGGLETARGVGHDHGEHRPFPPDRRARRAVRGLCPPSLADGRERKLLRNGNEVIDVAVVGFAQSPVERHGESTTSGVEMLVPVFAEVLRATGLAHGDIGIWCSGSSDYLAGRAFSFVQAVDAIGAFPPIMESHVEMDGAWALYEAWVK